MEKEENTKYLSVRVKKATHYKLTYIADYYERNLGSLCRLIYKQQIKAFEEKHGEIKLPADL